MKHRDSAGFTLMEILIVAVLAAILVTISVGGYGHSMRKTHRLNAMRALLQIAARQENFLLEHNRYARHLAELGLPPLTRNEMYKLAIGPSTDGAFSARAIAVSGRRQHADHECRELVIDSGGTRWPANCWR